MKTTLKTASAIDLQYQYKIVEDSVIIFDSEKCVVYLIAEESAHGKAIVKLEFIRAKCVRSARTDCAPGIEVKSKNSGNSFIVEIIDSSWPVEANDNYRYSSSAAQSYGKHFVVRCHDIFHEVLADSFEQSLVVLGEHEYEIARLHFP